MSDTPESKVCEHGGLRRKCDICALREELDDAIKERDAYKKAKQENYERFMRERDENKAGWDRASLTALDLEQRLKRAEKCISAIELHYKSKHGESYDHTTLNTIITSWRGNEKANTA